MGGWVGGWVGGCVGGWVGGWVGGDGASRENHGTPLAFAVPTSLCLKHALAFKPSSMQNSLPNSRKRAVLCRICALDLLTKLRILQKPPTPTETPAESPLLAGGSTACQRASLFRNQKGIVFPDQNFIRAQPSR